MERIADETGVSPVRISFVAALRLTDLRDKVRVFVCRSGAPTAPAASREDKSEQVRAQTTGRPCTSVRSATRVDGPWWRDRSPNVDIVRRDDLDHLLVELGQSGLPAQRYPVRQAGVVVPGDDLAVDDRAA
jgi:hypothetical protein